MQYVSLIVSSQKIKIIVVVSSYCTEFDRICFLSINAMFLWLFLRKIMNVTRVASSQYTDFSNGCFNYSTRNVPMVVLFQNTGYSSDYFFSKQKWFKKLLRLENVVVSSYYLECSPGEVSSHCLEFSSGHYIHHTKKIVPCVDSL